jgi:hypothetical protein
MKKFYQIFMVFIIVFIGMTINKYQIVNAEMLSIDFNELTETDVLTDQYLDKGVTFKLLDTPDGYIQGPAIIPIDSSSYPGASGMGLWPHDRNFENDFHFDIEILFSKPINYFSILSLDSDEPVTVRGFLNNSEIASKYYSSGSNLQVWNVELGNIDGEQLFDRIVIDVVRGELTCCAGGPEFFDNLKFNTVDICTEDDTGSIDVATSKGRYGGIASVPVRIQNAPNDVSAFGFDINFDSTILTYKGFTKGSLVQDFDYFDVNLMTDGILRCGGFTDDANINQNADGNLVCLEFDIAENSEKSKVEITGLEDDIINWQASSGCFAPGCTGDVNKDGKITPQDALSAFEKYMGICPTTDGTACADICADVNYDDDVTPADALCIFNKYLEKPSCLDAEIPSCQH